MTAEYGRDTDSADAKVALRTSLLDRRLSGATSSSDPWELLRRPAPVAASGLIGATLTIEGVGGIIVETEAYDIEDPASHSYRGLTPRNAPMFGPIGRAYVYRIYGLHWCLNIVCDASRPGSAVLIRALEPIQGLDAMIERRGDGRTRDLCAGPGRLCQALGVTGALNGLPIDAPPFRLQLGDPQPVTAGARIGVRHGAVTPWRFGRTGSPWLSRPIASRSPDRTPPRRTPGTGPD